MEGYLTFKDIEFEKNEKTYNPQKHQGNLIK